MSAAERIKKLRDKMSQEQKEQERHEAQKYGNIAYKNNDDFPVNTNFPVIFNSITSCL